MRLVRRADHPDRPHVTACNRLLPAARCAWSDARTILIAVRLVERIRRAIALEYGLPLSSLLPLQAYSRTANAGTLSEGGGGNLGGDGLPLHTDEATHACNRL